MDRAATDILLNATPRMHIPTRVDEGQFQPSLYTTQRRDVIRFSLVRSRAAGLGVHTVSNIENRAANVRLDTVNRLPIALNVDPCLLLSSAPAEAPGDYVERPLGESVAQNLKQLRLRLNLTQEQAATSAGLGRVYAYEIENQVVATTLDTLGALARVVGVETWQLLV